MKDRAVRVTEDCLSEKVRALLMFSGTFQRLAYDFAVFLREVGKEFKLPCECEGLLLASIFGQIGKADEGFCEVFFWDGLWHSKGRWRGARRRVRTYSVGSGMKTTAIIPGMKITDTARSVPRKSPTLEKRPKYTVPAAAAMRPML